MYLQICLVVTWLVLCETTVILAHVLRTSYNHALVYSVNYSKPHTWGTGVFSCNCHLHFLQNDRDCVCATAFNMGRYRHRNETTEKTIILLLLPGHESATFWSQVCCPTRTTEQSLLLPNKKGSLFLMPSQPHSFTAKRRGTVIWWWW